ncbi:MULTISPECIES: hypothetical protein [Flavobacteriaceae]|uniref:Lipocalin family protein n=1 Tax=Maribacter flavus TaxID=1658664 RepID=A0ABU7IKH2_9FLAO|nr:MULTISPECIES: hypothetical protein [Flavobacteriaceae]MDC6406332.1 hypothetical protein [Maribacter sp. PR66]MEE1973452.1 hypothetical protein [Maribacter flavus]NDV17718.1 hypothetical protein [Muricauda sp. TY007]
MKNNNTMKILVMSFFMGLAMVFTFQSCNDDDGKKNQENELTGQWLLFQRFDGDGIDSIDNGKTLIFTEDGVIKDSFVPNCDGMFSIEKDTLTINRPCHDEPIRFLFKFEENNLILTSIPSTCDEGCYDIFKKI